MIYTYEQCIDKYGSDYQIKKRILEGSLYKLEKGYYSNTKYSSYLELISIKYPKAILTMDSAFYYHNLTDVIPEKYYLATDKDAAKIADKDIKQVFVSADILEIGAEEIEYNGDRIRIYDKERLLIETVRNKSKLSYDYYKEIIQNYREILLTLDIQKIQEYAELFPKKRLINQRLRDEVF